MTPTLHYHPDAYTISGPKLMGRHAAGVSFLRGFLARDCDSFWAQVDQRDHGKLFERAVRAAGRKEPVKVIGKPWLRSLAESGILHRPDPAISRPAWERTQFGDGLWSLTGITHTTSSTGAMDAIVELLTAPVQPWDALICTSEAVRQNVVALFQAQADYLRHRLGITKTVVPTLPVIPLGIHSKDFDFSAEQRASARHRLAIDEDAIAVVYVGRLSFTAKAHPLAMYQALQRAAVESGKKVVLVECGWHGHPIVEQAFDAAARLACPDVQAITLDGRERENQLTAWACADIFCSLSDNIQETFGITPLEAMAAGLPVVVSDWDGYKETVRHGIDGFRVPTLMPRRGLSVDLAVRHALDADNYDSYCGHSALLTAVDVEAAARAFAQLFGSPDLRAKMGASGRDRVRSTYDWKVVIAQYEALWSELDARRLREAVGVAALPHPWPARLDPFHAYANYPTQTLDEATRLELTDNDMAALAARLRDFRALKMVDYCSYVIPTDEEVAQVIELLARGPQRAGDLLKVAEQGRHATILRGLGYLAKLGAIRLAS